VDYRPAGQVQWIPEQKCVIERGLVRLQPKQRLDATVWQFGADLEGSVLRQFLGR
jgi:hypothetical protein